MWGKREGYLSQPTTPRKMSRPKGGGTLSAKRTKIPFYGMVWRIAQLQTYSALGISETHFFYLSFFWRN
ncbi:MAG: hypothetical protein ACRC2T_13800 [Thermoguttaceae bacterium]